MGKVFIHRLAGTKKAQEACRLIEALYAKGKRVVAWVADGGRASTFDEYLWTFAQHSFVPHALAASGEEVEDPVAVVTGALANPNHAEVLVIVDLLPNVQDAAGFAEIHDFVTLAPEDAGKVEAWSSAGVSVDDKGGAGRSDPRRDKIGP